MVPIAMEIMDGICQNLKEKEFIGLKFEKEPVKICTQ